MRAIVHHEYGGAEVLRLDDLPTPTPGTGEVRLRVIAAGIDAGISHLMEGSPRVVRLAIGLRRPRTGRLGIDVAGVVDAVGPEVDTLAVGDLVYGAGSGTLAEIAVAKARHLRPVPLGVDPVKAASLTVSGVTAVQAIAAAGVSAGHRVLITGAGGGVGVHAVQLAVAAGAEVTAVCSAAKAELVRSLGAARVIDYTSSPVDGGPYDAILDIAGGRDLATMRALLTRRGILLMVGSEGGGPVLGGLARQLQGAAQSPWVSQRLRSLVSTVRPESLDELHRHVVAGTVRPVVERRFPLADAAAAIEHQRAGRVLGKVVVVTGAAA